jgi:pimeloyl-ACP methyl ester carboxylesterase
MASRPRVLVLPGLGGGDGSTQVLRSSLAAQGFRAHRWKLGRNMGPSPELAAGLRSRFFDLVELDDEPIALVGWSLGGVYAHHLAEFAPHQVRSVITLGSPLRRSGPRASLRVPTTSIYSRNDRVVNWQASLIDDRVDRHENIEVRSLHLTLGFDPAVLYAVSDRLRRPPDKWVPFTPPPLLSSAFPKAPTIPATGVEVPDVD